MQWLTPFTALYAALVTVPLLLLLYFLKLKRHEHIVSSTLLWQRAIRDLQVNAPFQKLRHNILLLLQLLTLVALLFAIAWPVLRMKTGPGRRYVLLIDRSASMNTIDDDPTSGGPGNQSRLEKAKEQAKIFVESMRQKAAFSLRDDSDQTMVIAFDDHAKVMCNFTSDKRQLIYAIDSISGGHGKSSLSEAVTVARAFSQTPGGEADYLNQEQPATLQLFSDGRINDLPELTVGTDEIVYHSLGAQPSENAGITAMQALRSYENPDEVEVFASVSNFSDKPLTTNLQLGVNNDVKDIRQITIPALRVNDTKTEEPGTTSVNFQLSDVQSGVIEIRLLSDDCLDCDNVAWSVVSPPKKLSVLLVTSNNPALESALKACPLAKFEVQSPAQFDALDQAATSLDNPWDVIVLDNHVNDHLPKGRYIVFGQPPQNIDVNSPGQLENQVIIDWRQKHPVLNYVNLMTLFAAKCYKMDLPRDADILAEFNESPALALVERNGSIFLLVGFDIMETNWPFEPGFVLFCYNATSYLGLQVTQEQKDNLEVGDPIVVEGVEPGTEAEITMPDKETEVVRANPSGTIRFANTSRVGQYSLSISDGPARFYAVNLLNAQESNIKPLNELGFSNSETVEAQEKIISRANMPLWPFLVGFALLLACLEWVVYNYKVRI
ncbi:MAG: VWA domain-containing protein [Sedimentisphaerales bacterium]